MNGGNQSLEEILFDLAVQKTDAADRAAFLDHACHGYPALRAALEELLEAYFDEVGFLSKRSGAEAPPAAPLGASAPKPTGEAPEQALPNSETPPAQ